MSYIKHSTIPVVHSTIPFHHSSSPFHYSIPPNVDTQLNPQREKFNPHETSEIETLNSTESDTLGTVSYWAHSGRVSISYVATAALFSKQVLNDSHSLSQHYWLSQMDQLFHNCFFCYFSTGARILGSSSVSALLSSVATIITAFCFTFVNYPDHSIAVWYTMETFSTFHMHTSLCS